MKIAIISDWHLGLNERTELEDDSFNQLKQGFKQIQEKDVDLVLAPGDLFDKQIPSQETYYKAIKLLDDINIKNNLEIKTQNKFLKIPMIAIVGNHEYRGRDYRSTVEILEAVGFLKFLHANSISVKKENQKKVNIFGLSGIPDEFSKKVLDKWNPKPIDEDYNILMIHQSILDYMPYEGQEGLKLSNLPEGFDIIINGHLHWQAKEKISEKTTFIMPGSTVSTQNKKIESQKNKGFYILDTENNSLEFEEIKNIRPVFYIDLKIEKKTISEIKQRIYDKLNEIVSKNLEKKPLVRLRLKGELLEGYFLEDLKTNEIKKEFQETMYLTISNLIQEKKLKESLEKLKSLQKEKADLKNTSRDVFFEQISQTKVSKDFDYKRMFEIFKENDTEKIKEIIEKEIEKIQEK